MNSMLPVNNLRNDSEVYESYYPGVDEQIQEERPLTTEEKEAKKAEKKVKRKNRRLRRIEKTFKRLEWESFKDDVSLKTLITNLDKGIKRRSRLIVVEDAEENARIQRIKAMLQKMKIAKFIALGLYILLPIFERPAWCIKNPNIGDFPTWEYWHCQDADKRYVNSDLPKLPPVVSNIIYIICILVLLVFTKARDAYRKLDARDRISRNIQISL